MAEHEHWSGGSWFAVPRSWADVSGVLWLLSDAERSVLLGLLSRANHRTGVSVVSLDELGAMASRARDPKQRRETARRAVRGLERGGVVEVLEYGGGRNQANKYRVVNPRRGAGVLGEETPAGERGKATEKPPQGNRQTPAGEPLNPRTPAGPTDIQMTDQQGDGSAGGDGSAAAALSDEEEKRRVLVGAGVGESALSELASDSRLTPATVKQVVERLLGRGGGPGLIVNELRAKAGQVDAEREQAEQRAERERREQAERAKVSVRDEQDAEQSLAERQADAELVAGLDDEHRRRLVEQARAGASAMLRGRWLAADYDLERLPDLRRRVAELARSNGKHAVA